MKKFFLGAVGLVALGLAAPAPAADLAAKAPGPMMAAIYDWTGFYIGANGGWGSSRKCWNGVYIGRSAVASAFGAAASLVAKLVIAGKAAHGSSGLKRKAIGRTFADPTQAPASSSAPRET